MLKEEQLLEYIFEKNGYKTKKRRIGYKGQLCQYVDFQQVNAGITW